MVDGFNRLRHDAVVCSDDEDGNIRNLSAAGTHSRKGFVARRIHEGDLLAFVTDLVSPDVLGNAAGFVAGDIGLTDGVEKARFTVVDVTHDGDDRRTGFQGFRGIDDFFDFRRIFRRSFHGNGDAEFIGNQRGRIKVEFLVDSRHDTSHEELLHDFTDIAAQPFCEIFNDDRFRQFNRRRIVLLRHFSRDRSLIFLIPLIFMLALV